MDRVGFLNCFCHNCAHHLLRFFVRGQKIWSAVHLKHPSDNFAFLCFVCTFRLEGGISPDPPQLVSPDPPPDLVYGGPSGEMHLADAGCSVCKTRFVVLSSPALLWLNSAEVAPDHHDSCSAIVQLTGDARLQYRCVLVCSWLCLGHAHVVFPPVSQTWCRSKKSSQDVNAIPHFVLPQFEQYFISFDATSLSKWIRSGFIGGLGVVSTRVL